MALTVETFINAHPEFAGVDVELVELKLADALLYVPAHPWGDFADQGQGLMCAHLLALSPFGNGTALVAKDGTTTYEAHWKRLVRIVTAGIRST
jgi:hypothetical protein